MIRALITAALTAIAANQILHVPIDAALGYSLVICLAGWYLWPLLHRPIRFLLRHLRRHRTRASNTPAPTTQRPGPTQITQINHHYYNGTPAQPGAQMRPDYTLSALPRRTEGRIASDDILDGIIDIDDDGTR